jgi:hypothetical protein
VRRTGGCRNHRASCKQSIRLVGVTGFEPAKSCSQIEPARSLKKKIDFNGEQSRHGQYSRIRSRLRVPGQALVLQSGISRSKPVLAATPDGSPERRISSFRRGSWYSRRRQPMAVPVRSQRHMPLDQVPTTPPQIGAGSGIPYRTRPDCRQACAAQRAHRLRKYRASHSNELILQRNASVQLSRRSSSWQICRRPIIGSSLNRYRICITASSGGNASALRFDGNRPFASAHLSRRWGRHCAWSGDREPRIYA